MRASEPLEKSTHRKALYPGAIDPLNMQEGVYQKARRGSTGPGDPAFPGKVSELLVELS